MANILRCVFDSKDEWPVKDVTVYEDRAQVVRILQYKATDPGDAELKLTNLPTSLISDSIRAEINTGNATVLEVTSERVTGKAGEILVTEREMEISQRQKELQKEKRTIVARRELLQSYVDSMIPSAKPPMKATENVLFESISNPENLTKFAESLNRYTEELKKSKSRELEIQIEERLLAKEKALILTEKNIKSLETAIATTEIAVLLHVPEETAAKGIIEVKVSYVVNNCSWKATYDLRVNKVENIVDLAYFGQVVNGSGEDWEEVQMFLSTAKPSRGGSLPRLPRANVMYIVKEEKKFVKVNRRGKRRKHKQKIQIIVEEDESFSDESMCSSEDDLDLESAIEMDYEPTIDTGRVKKELEEIVSKNQTVAEERGGAATFKLNRLCSIESDNIPHKQSIAALTLQPRFSYTISPEVSPTAYLRCTARNDSSFILVRGEMNVFFNGSFVTTTELKLVNKNQEFKIFLGKDESIKVGISPQTSKKETTKGGLMTSKVNKQTYSRKLLIENTREEEVELQLLEQLPLARDKKIKVEVISPNMNKKKKNEGYRINFMNHLEVKRYLKPGKSWEFTFTYRVEWPKDTSLVYTQSLENLAR